ARTIIMSLSMNAATLPGIADELGLPSRSPHYAIPQAAEALNFTTAKQARIPAMERVVGKVFDQLSSLKLASDVERLLGEEGRKIVWEWAKGPEAKLLFEEWAKEGEQKS